MKHRVEVAQLEEDREDQVAVLEDKVDMAKEISNQGQGALILEKQDNPIIKLQHPESTVELAALVLAKGQLHPMVHLLFTKDPKKELQNAMLKIILSAVKTRKHKASPSSLPTIRPGPEAKA